MNRAHINQPAPRPLAQPRRLSALTLLALLMALLAPLAFSLPSAHAQSSAGGTVVAWGDNTFGQTNVPSGLSDVVAIAAGNLHSLALKRDGTVVAWGLNEQGQASVPSGLSDVVAIAAGTLHSLALKRDGTVVAWGYNNAGQANVPSGLSDVVAIAGGGYHSLALKRDGTVVGWGLNDQGQASAPSGLSDVVAIAGGVYHSLALKRDGTVVAWGGIDSGEASVPSGLSDVVAIDTAFGHNLALKRDGSVVGSGWNSGEEESSLSDVVAIAAGYWHNLALKRDGSVAGWGWNDYGQTNVPSGLSDVVAIAAGGRHSLALVVDTTAPTVTANVNQASPSARAIVTLDASDTLSGVASTSYSINGGAPKSYTHPFVLSAPGSYLISFTSTDIAGNSAAPQSIPVTVAPLAPIHSASVELISAPPSAAENALESDQLIRLFAERQNYTLPADITVNGSVVAAGTRVNVFYIHADKLGNTNSAALKLMGSVTFGTKVLAVIGDSTTLLSTNGTLGSASTTYSTRTDQGIEYDDSATLSGQNQLNLAFNLWSMSDNVRVITLAE